MLISIFVAAVLGNGLPAERLPQSALAAERLPQVDAKLADLERRLEAVELALGLTAKPLTGNCPGGVCPAPNEPAPAKYSYDGGKTWTETPPSKYFGSQSASPCAGGNCQAPARRLFGRWR